MKKLIYSILLAGSLCTSASETHFGYVKMLDLLPAGAWEYEQHHTYRTGKEGGDYSAVDLRNEFEVGATDNLKVALYLNSSYQNINGVPGMQDRTRFDFDGMSAELVWRVLSPYKDSIGLGFYIEPGVILRSKRSGNDENERKLETRILLQKNFMGDDLITAFNLKFEPEWVKEDGVHEKELKIEANIGASYRLTEKWFAGLEARSLRTFADMNTGHEAHQAFFAGPNVHYGSARYWWTLSVLPLISSSPEKTRQYDNLEARLIVAIPLGDTHKSE